MVDVGFDETVLLFGRGILGRVAGEGGGGVVIVVAPLGKMIGKLETYDICGGILEVDYNELFVFVGWL